MNSRSSEPLKTKERLIQLKYNITTEDHMERLSYGITTTSSDYTIIDAELSKIDKPLLKDYAAEFLRIFKKYNTQKNMDTKVGRMLILTALLIWFMFVFYMQQFGSAFWVIIALIGTIIGVSQGISLLVRHRDDEDRLVDLLDVLIDNID